MLVEWKSKQMAIDDIPEPMPSPIRNPPYCELFTIYGVMNRMNCILLSSIIDGPQYNGHYTKKSMLSMILSWNEISDVTPFLRKEGRHLDNSTRIYLANFYCGMNSQNWNYARKIAWTHLFCTIDYSSNKIRKTQNEHLNIVCQNLNSL